MPRYAPAQIVDNLVYVNSDDSANYESYEAPALTVDSLSQQEAAVTKS